MEVPVKFKNKDGLTLYGILHKPERPRSPKTGLIFIFSGVRGRVGTSRQYVEYARRLCDREGYYVLRYDVYGMGDSEGDVPPCPARYYYGTIQTGRYVDDAVSGVQFFLNEVEVEKKYLFGLCGGAITALLAGKVLKVIDGYILLSIPTFIDDPDVDYYRRYGWSYYWLHLLPYIYKLKSPKAWYRLLTGKTNIPELLDVLKGSFIGGIEAIKRKIYEKIGVELSPPKDTSIEHSEETKGIAHMNKLFLDAYSMIMTRGKPILFIFGDHDIFYEEFVREFQSKYMDRDPRAKDLCEVYVISKANHMFTLGEWKKKVIEKTVEWLDRQTKV